MTLPEKKKKKRKKKKRKENTISLYQAKLKVVLPSVTFPAVHLKPLF